MVSKISSPLLAYQIFKGVPPAFSSMGVWEPLKRKEILYTSAAKPDSGMAALENSVKYLVVIACAFSPKKKASAQVPKRQ